MIYQFGQLHVSENDRTEGFVYLPQIDLNRKIKINKIVNYYFTFEATFLNTTVYCYLIRNISFTVNFINILFPVMYNESNILITETQFDLLISLSFRKIS